MALNNTTADALAADIAAALAALDRGEDVTDDAWQLICRKIYAALKADILIDVLVTTGPGAPGTGTGTAQ